MDVTEQQQRWSNDDAAVVLRRYAPEASEILHRMIFTSPGVLGTLARTTCAEALRL
ncbi:hypothetical protein [Rhodococcus sp. IEGM 1379]|uniref:hypothetical protein n=1 Tax=Rhodococcus sp. IEGM 1379 TaxID=3047086 RepID=UPI0024B795A7|nr:hypothetical protein [Rhodococcus sp. IEGM 1379]MDI9917154.1 hypothetical protein [Rhodococcus sp. IEGM 1379]